MQRFLMTTALAAWAACSLTSMANAQTVVYTGRPYIPVIVVPPPTPAYYIVPAPTTSYYVAPASTTVTYSSSVSYYPSVVPQSVVTYSAPAVIRYPAPGVYVSPSVIETRSSYSYGVLRPRGYYTEVRVRP